MGLKGLSLSDDTMKAVYTCTHTTGLLRDGSERRRLHVLPPARPAKPDERGYPDNVHGQDNFAVSNSLQGFHAAVQTGAATAHVQVRLKTRQRQRQTFIATMAAKKLDW